MKERPPEIKRGVPERKMTPALSGVIKDELGGYNSTLKADTRPTPIDFPALPEGATEEDFLIWVKNVLGIDPKIIKEDGKTEESKLEYSKLDKALKQAQDFLGLTLKYKDREIPENPSTLESKKDLLELLGKTIATVGNSGISNRALIHCRLVRAAIASYETIRQEAELLIEETEYFERTFFKPPLVPQGIYDNPFVLLEKEDGKTRFGLRGPGNIKGVLSSRGKNVYTAMIRFITRPEESAATLLKDGIASKISIETEDAEKLLPVLFGWLVERKQATHLNVENKSYFTGEDWKNKIGDLQGQITLSNEPNDEFQALVIDGIIPFWKKDGTTKYPRHFEIQLVTPWNKNEKGKMNHAVYDVMRKVIARTRLDGGCPERVFNEFIKEASDSSHIGEEKVKEYLVGRKNIPIKRKIIKLGKDRHARGESSFVSYAVYERWGKLVPELVPPALLLKVKQLAGGK